MRLALGVEYDGGAFSGFQQQKHARSVQQVLQEALARVADHPVSLLAAGRTDAGVHATGQVVAFSTHAQRPLHGWQRGVNALTPAAVSVRWVQSVAEDFHPRFAATARRYQYLFYETGTLSQARNARSPLLDPYAVATSVLDDGAMHAAAQVLLGEHDFTAFRAAGCQSRTPFRRVDRLAVQRHESLVVIDITANAFLLHMVRNIAGALWQIGRGERPTAWLSEVLGARDRARTGPTAPPEGLYLVHVDYPGAGFPAPVAPGLLRALGGLDRFS